MKYGELFDDKANSNNNRFKNITETYKAGTYTPFDELFTTGEFKDSYFTPAQFQKELSTKNTERMTNLVTNMKALTADDITALMTSAKITAIADISKSNTDLSKAIMAKFPTLSDGYREFNYLLTKDADKKTDILTTWTATLDAAKTAADNLAKTKKIDANLTSFTSPEILKKYATPTDDIYKYNSENTESKFTDIITAVKNAITANKTNTKFTDLMTLLEDGKITEFQKTIYGDNPTSKYTDWNDGKFGQETLDRTNTYIADNTTAVENNTGEKNTEKYNTTQLETLNKAWKDVLINDKMTLDKDFALTDGSGTLKK